MKFISSLNYLLPLAQMFFDITSFFDSQEHSTPVRLSTTLSQTCRHNLNALSPTDRLEKRLEICVLSVSEFKFA